VFNPGDIVRITKDTHSLCCSSIFSPGDVFQVEKLCNKHVKKYQISILRDVKYCHFVRLTTNNCVKIGEVNASV